MTSPLKPTRATARCLAKLVNLCESLPEAVAEPIPAQHHVSFKVRKRTFGYYLFDHHGDGRIALCAKAHPGEQQELVAHDPETYFVPAYLGARGWLGVWLDGDEIDWTAVGSLVLTSYRLIAPKRLAELVQ